MISEPNGDARAFPESREIPLKGARPHPPPCQDASPESFASGHGTQDLRTLLRALDPVQEPGVWVYAELPRDAGLPRGTVVAVAEKEGLTVVLPEADAETSGLRPLFRAAWLTLRVHSALEAVGLVAEVSRCLARAGIACNVIAGAKHDHLLVPYDRASEALDVLRGLQRQA